MAVPLANTSPDEEVRLSAVYADSFLSLIWNDGNEVCLSGEGWDINRTKHGSISSFSHWQGNIMGYSSYVNDVYVSSHQLGSFCVLVKQSNALLLAYGLWLSLCQCVSPNPRSRNYIVCAVSWRKSDRNRFCVFISRNGLLTIICL